MKHNVLFRWIMISVTRACMAAFVLVGASLAQGAPFVEPDVALEQAEDLREAESVAFVFNGIVHAPNGTPAVGAVVVSAAGGQAVTDSSGEFRLEARVSREIKSVQITAVARGNAKLLANKLVQISGASGPVSTGYLQLAQTNGCSPSWLPLASGMDNRVIALTVFDDGNGEQLIAGGNFTTAGGVPANNIAKWDGSGWTPLGSGINAEVRALTVFDDGNGQRLYAGGQFTSAGGVAANGIAKWDGSSWTPLGSGMSGSVVALTVFDDGNGEQLIAGGFFTTAGGVTANNLAKWDGSGWTPLASGVGGGGGAGPTGFISALTVFDNGNGQQLVAGGGFATAGGVPANHIAKWDGSGWTPLASGMNSFVRSLTVLDDGNGEQLYAGGCFNLAGGVTANRIAKWDGSSWTPLGSGMGFTFNGETVWALTAFDDGHGQQLYAGGKFPTAGGVAANNIAKWDGSSWTPLGSGVNSPFVLALTVFDNGNGEQLVVAGEFTAAGGVAANRIAQWGCPTLLTEDLCSGDGGNQAGCTNCPCTNNAQAGTVGGCLNSASTAARLAASGDHSVSLPAASTTDLRFALSGAPPLAFTILNSGDGVAPANAANPCFGLNSGAQAAPFDGLRCAIQNTRRHGGRSADSNGDVGVTNSPWGGEGGPPVGIAIAGGGFVSGQTRYFQVIYHDDPLASCMRGLNTSQAIRITFTP